jgi:nitrite reductase/ring-hydroxylating ferredoxin subunit
MWTRLGCLSWRRSQSECDRYTFYFNIKLSFTDSTCAHLGANLAGGKVVGNHIQCPFHNWEYNGNGSCVRIPYTDAPIPEAAQVKSWPSKQRPAFSLSLTPLQQ